MYLLRAFSFAYQLTTKKFTLQEEAEKFVIGENESAKFWAGVLNSLRNRGVDDILIACTDNLTGFSQAIEAVFPKTDI